MDTSLLSTYLLLNSMSGLSGSSSIYGSGGLSSLATLSQLDSLTGQQTFRNLLLDALGVQSSTTSVGTKTKSAYTNTADLDAGPELNAIFEEAAATYGVDVNLLKAVGKEESGFNPKATSWCGAMGVMQLMPETAAGLGVTDGYDARQNIMGGAKLLASQLKEYNGNVELALAAYSAGGGAVAQYGGVPPYEETINAIRKVKDLLGGSFVGGLTEASSSSSQTTTGKAVSASSASTGSIDSKTLNTLVELMQMQMQMRIASSLGNLGNTDGSSGLW